MISDAALLSLNSDKKSRDECAFLDPSCCWLGGLTGTCSTDRPDGRPNSGVGGGLDGIDDDESEIMLSAVARSTKPSFKQTHGLK